VLIVFNIESLPDKRNKNNTASTCTKSALPYYLQKITTIKNIESEAYSRD